MTWILRFFHVVDGMPRWMQLMTILLAGYAAVMASLDTRSVDESLAVLLLWQMLSAATGFARPAASGFFDPVLTRSDRRLIAVAHALHSVWPVALAWLVIALVDVAAHGRAPLAFEPGRLAAFLFVSVVSWALSLPAPRLVTGALWLFAIVAAATTRFGTEQYASLIARADGSAGEAVHATVLAAACPFLMLGNHIPARGVTAAALVTLAATAAVAGAALIVGRDYPLEPSL